MNQCNWCNKEIKPFQKYCNSKCYHEAWKITVLAKIKQKDKRTFQKCILCGNEFKDFASNHRKYCSQKCAKFQKGVEEKGNLHWNWHGGATRYINQRCNSKWWIELRNQIYKRDNWTCQKCGRKCTSKNDESKIQCDHIIKERDGGSHDPSNLQTLCRKCHIEKDWTKEKQIYEEKFCDTCHKELIPLRGMKNWEKARYCSRACSNAAMKTPEAKEYYRQMALKAKFWKHRTNL